MINRRHFIRTIVAATAIPSINGCQSGDANATGIGALVPDPEGILDLPRNFSDRVVATQGEEMDDGLLVPARADGMGAFPGKDGRVILVCNHENPPVAPHFGPFGPKNERLKLCDPTRIYDCGKGETPGTGGTTTIVYDPSTGRRERQHLSLAGTEYNCAGGTTPWGSWLSCEEAFEDSGPATMFEIAAHRDKRHGYVFEVPANATDLVEPVPLRDMGRFEHEACAVDPASGVIYLTEDRHRSLLYRFLPNVPGKLAQGGRLQALAILGKPSFDTRNWDGSETMREREWYDTEWVDLDEADSDDDDLRLRGYRDGAARFARGEGLCYADGSIFITCTIGGRARYGQVFEYRVSEFEGTAEESASPGKIRIIAEATGQSLLRNADNLTMSPWGDLIVCEDRFGHCGLIGIQPDGQQYKLADNAYTHSELAGACFSPNGKILFVNIQERGLTLAITGPWPLPA